MMRCCACLLNAPWLATGLLIWLLASLSCTVVLANIPVNSAQPTEETTEESDFLQQFAEISETYFTFDWYVIKLEFYNASGIFSFLNSGDTWCPNRLMIRWCDEAL